MEFIKSVSNVSKIKNFSNQIDYFNYRILPGFILACSLLMSWKQYLMKPISCYTSNVSQGTGFDDYITNFCYITSTYFTDPSRKLQQTNMYFWFPVILLLQAITFCLPKSIWVHFGNESYLRTCWNYALRQVKILITD